MISYLTVMAIDILLFLILQSKTFLKSELEDKILFADALVIKVFSFIF